MIQKVWQTVLNFFERMVADRSGSTVSTPSSKKPSLAEAFVIAILLLGLSPALWLAKLDTDRTFILDFANSDAYFKYIPNANLFAELLRKGDVPLWNPYHNCGTPLLALGYFGPLYPLNITRRFLEPSTAFAAANILHIFILTVGMYMFCRKSYLSPLASFFSASALMLGRPADHLLTYHPFMFYTSALLPLGLFCAKNAAIKGRGLTWAILFSLVLALQVLAGTPEIALTTAYFGCGYIVVRGLLDAVRMKRATPFVAAAFLAGTICVAALLASSVQVVPELELVIRSNRPTVQLELMRSFSRIFPYDLTAYVRGLFWTPHVNEQPPSISYGTPSVSYGMFYLGILTPLLTLIALGDRDPRRRVETRFFVIAGLLCGIMLMIRYPIAQHLIYIIGLGRVRWINWLIPGYGFAMAYVAGVGFDRVFCQTESDPKRALIGYGIPVLAVIGGAYLFSNLRGQRLLFVYLGLMMLALAGRVAGITSTGKSCRTYKGLVPLSLVVMLPVIAVLINLCDLWQSFTLRHQPRWASRDEFEGIPKEFTKFLEKVSTDYSRSFISCPNDKKWVVPPIYGELKILGVDDETPLVLGRTATLFETVTGTSNLACGGWLGPLCNTERGVRLSKLFSTEFYVCEPGEVYESLKKTGMYPVFESEGVIICRDASYLPRAYFVPGGNAHIFSEPEGAFLHILSRKFDPFADVAIEVVPGRQRQPPWQPRELAGHKSAMMVRGVTHQRSVTITASEPREVQIKARVPAPGYLVLTDTFYPGWRAYVDGVETPIYQANYLFRAVPLNAGDHEVRFVYRPKSFAVGAALSLTFLLTVVSAGLIRALLKT